MIGYLDPNGKFYSCDTYMHTDFAKELCEKIYSKEPLSGFLTEDYLLSKNWIVFRSRAVYNNLKGNITAAQLSFIDNNLEEIVINDGIKKTLNNMLLMDRDLKEDK